MGYREQVLGDTALFLLPSLKLKNRSSKGVMVEEDIHQFLMQNFGGYTAAAGNIFGYWKDPGGDTSYGEHRQFVVATDRPYKVETLKCFLARLATELKEQSIYVEIAGRAVLIYAT